MAILDGILSAWRLEDTSGNLVDAVGSNDLTATDVTYSVTGKVGNCVTFSGVSTSKGIITNANQVNLNVPSTEDRTFAFWFKTSSGAAAVMLDKRSPSDSPAGALQHYIFPTGALEIFFVADSGTSVTLDSTTTGLNDGNWHLVITTFTRTGTGLRLYIDNVEDANSPKSASGLGAVASSGSFTLGCSNFSAAYQYTGALDEVIIWNRVITAGERTTLWNGGAGTNIFSAISITSGVISAWRMEDASGNLLDTIGGNTLTASNLSYHQTGKVNFATGYNGSSSTATITNASQVGLNIGLGESRTYAVWFKTSTAAEGTIFCKPDDASAGNIAQEFILDTPGGMNAFFRDASSNTAYCRSAAGYSNGIFHLAFCTFTRAINGLRLFMDNVELRTGSQPSPANASALGDLTNTFDFQLGARQVPAPFYNGLIDELIVWNRVLTSTERRIVWNNGNGADIFLAVSSPSIISVSPTSSFTQGGNLITITGHQFSVSPVPTIYFGADVATNVQTTSSNYLTCIAPAHAQSTFLTITLQNPDGGSTTFPGFRYDAFAPFKVLRPPKYYRNSRLTFAQRRNGVNNYTP